MSEKIIKGLNIEDCKILKQIIIVSDRKYGETEIGSIFYKRNFTEDYKLNEVNEDEDPLDKLLYDYPKQENYPNDRLDEIIFESIKKNYPKSVLKNALIIFNVDLEKLEILKNKNSIKAKIYFTPWSKTYSDLYQFAGKTFKSPEVDLHVYSNYSDEITQGQTFIASYLLEEENVLNKLSAVEFE